ncbi:MAG: hypothetical protein IT297_00100 [Anaerolineae bacterium]|nr:hypothetical protein [Anaerolineae bacterium]
MDLSTRDVEDIFDALGVSINRMTVWREGQKLIEELSQQKLLSLDRRYTIIRREAGGELVPNGLSLSLSLDSSTILMLGNMLAESREALIAWLKTVLADLEIEIRDLSEFDLEVHELVHLSQ